MELELKLETDSAQLAFIPLTSITVSMMTHKTKEQTPTATPYAAWVVGGCRLYST